jgi:hypothetical protein
MELSRSDFLLIRYASRLYQPPTRTVAAVLLREDLGPRLSVKCLKERTFLLGRDLTLLPKERSCYDITSVWHVHHLILVLNSHQP